MSKTLVQSGLDVLATEKCKRLHGVRIALLANQASVDRSLRHILDIFREHKVNVVKLFAPEHGFHGARQDMATVADAKDAAANIPIISLYGHGVESLSPKDEMLKDVDMVVADLPDIGTRYYTFAQTIGYLMQVAKRTGTKVVVLDRPNPIGGGAVEGAPLRKSCRSFCGYAPVPNRHGLTMGELAVIMNKGFGDGEDAIPAIGCDLEVVAMKGWKREMMFADTGLPWVLPSPNMPTFETALVYPGTCLFEATTVSEGRGTTRPFELIGAPYVDPQKWISETPKMGLTLNGAVLRPVAFEPQFQKFTRQTCYGIQLHVTDVATFQPFRWGLALLASLAKLYPKDFSWRSDAYEFVDKVPAIDLLYGSARFRELVEKNSSLAPLEDELSAFERPCLTLRKPFLLYT